MNVSLSAPARIRLILLLMVTALALASCATSPNEGDVNPTAPSAGQTNPSTDNARVSELGGGSPEWLQASESYVRCMIEEGWESRETDSGTIFGFPEGQETAFAESDARCSASSGQDALIEGYSLSPELLRAGYAAAVATHACIEAQGVSLSDPPSEQSFIESGGGWSPYLDLDDELVEMLLPLCPQP